MQTSFQKRAIYAPDTAPVARDYVSSSDHVLDLEGVISTLTGAAGDNSYREKFSAAIQQSREGNHKPFSDLVGELGIDPNDVVRLMYERLSCPRGGFRVKEGRAYELANNK